MRAIGEARASRRQSRFWTCARGLTASSRPPQRPRLGSSDLTNRESHCTVCRPASDSRRAHSGATVPEAGAALQPTAENGAAQPPVTERYGMRIATRCSALQRTNVPQRAQHAAAKGEYCLSSPTLQTRHLTRREAVRVERESVLRAVAADGTLQRAEL